MRGVSTRERARDRGRRRGERLLATLLGEAREARISLNVTQAAVADALGISRSLYGQIERGERRNVPLVTMAEILGVLGHELAARAYPAGGGLRDAAQIALLGRFRERVSTGFT